MDPEANQHYILMQNYSMQPAAVAAISQNVQSSGNSKKNSSIDLMKRPARKQAEYAPEREAPPHTGGGNYNIWYNRYAGDFRHRTRGERATTRCDPLLDSGWTVGSKKAIGTSNKGTYFCLGFARGNCHHGKDCTYLHRIPTMDDEQEGARDCFGRDRHREERYDMGGVGTFSRNNKTLYVGAIHSYGSAEKMDHIVRRHFGAFGEIEKVKILFSKNVAFVSFKKRSNAEFAKEAMDRQHLDSKECLNVRWATEDSNPNAQAELKRKNEEEFVQAWLAKKARTGEPVDTNDDPYAALTQMTDGNIGPVAPVNPVQQYSEQEYAEYYAQYYSQCYGYDYSQYYAQYGQVDTATDTVPTQSGVISDSALHGISQIVKQKDEAVKNWSNTGGDEKPLHGKSEQSKQSMSVEKKIDSVMKEIEKKGGDENDVDRGRLVYYAASDDDE